MVHGGLSNKASFETVKKSLGAPKNPRFIVLTRNGLSLMKLHVILAARMLLVEMNRNIKLLQLPASFAIFGILKI